MWQSLPEFGTGILYAVLVAAAYTFAVAVAAGRGRPRLLQSARLGAYGTSALIGVGVLLLAYAFVTHDFRIRYVARYSDRSMTITYLLTALWGGQDGSLLWWTTLLALYTASCVRWLKGRYRALQPYVIATLMVVVAFFGVLMLFAANPFQTHVAGVPGDGEGLNPLLQNYWMIIHPPALYMGFVGCTIPFSFAVAALVTGRTDNEWIVAVRKWMLFAWLFLSIGNVLGMIWAYEELGWGGFWAWDPVENAAALPWFTATAYVHSTMIQERRNMFRLWNVVLIVITFFLTIFGTFLTRSGLIASVHSFAQSDIGIFFVWAMAVIVASSVALIVWRLPQLRSRAHIESVASREAMFVMNNWALLGAAVFVAVVTLVPKLSEWLVGESITVGPPFFNRWMTPIGLVIFALMGLAPLFGWRKTSSASLRRAFVAPVSAGLLTALAHLLFGRRFGYPGVVPSAEPYPGALGAILEGFEAVVPVITVSLVVFNTVVVIQEFVLGVSARRAAAARRDESEPILVALGRLIAKSRRRYGGYIVHLGIVAMFLGFVGTVWTENQEASLLPGEVATIGPYEITFRGTRVCPGQTSCSPEEQADLSKRMIFAELDLSRGGVPAGRMEPAKFIYPKSPMGPTTEVAMRRSLKEDLYLVLGTADPTTKRATFQFHLNPFVSWIWVGILILIAGASISLWPDLQLGSVGAWSYVRASAGVTASIALALWLAASPTSTRTSTPGPEEHEGYRATLLSESLATSPWTMGMVIAPIFGLMLGGLRVRANKRLEGKP